MQEKSKYQLRSDKKPLKFASIVITLFVLLACNCFGQSITWQKVLINNGISYFTSVVQTDDEGYIAAGRHQYINNHMYLVRFNKFGDTLWSKEYEKEDATCIIKTNDDNFVISGRLGSFVKIDANGNILNLGTFIDEEARILKVVQSNDSNYFMCGYIFTLGLFYPYLLKYNSSGALLWDSIYTNGITGGQFSDMVLSNDNSLMITGFHYLQNGQPYYLFLKKIDLNGNQLWNNTLFSYNYLTPTTIIKTESNIYFISCVYSAILKFSNSGIFQWRKDYDTLFQSGIESMTNTIDGNIIYTAYLDTGNNYSSVRIRKLDTTGVELFSKSSGFENHNHTPWEIKQTNDSGFIVVGRTDFSNENAYILKTNKNGELPTGINIISTEIPNKFELFQNYPNPFNPVTSINFDISLKSEVKLIIYNSLGQTVENIDFGSQNAGSYNYKWHSSNIPSGIYFCKIIAGDSFNVIKMILLK